MINEVIVNATNHTTRYSLSYYSVICFIFLNIWSFDYYSDADSNVTYQSLDL